MSRDHDHHALRDPNYAERFEPLWSTGAW